MMLKKKKKNKASTRKNNNNDTILDSGIYIVRICRGKNAYIKEIHHEQQKLFCNQWIYIVDYGPNPTLDRKVLSYWCYGQHTYYGHYPNS